MRHTSRWISLVSAGIGVTAAAAFILLPVTSPELHAEAKPKFKFTGAGNCSAAKCHGGAEVKNGNTQSNEFIVWTGKDKHSKTFESLTKDESSEITKKMNLGDPTKAVKCLTCHSTGDGERQGLSGVAFNDKGMQGPKFDVENGVSCDACHGPSEKWLEPHSKLGWTDDQRKKFPNRQDLFMQMGLFDTKQIMLRANNCASCHLRIDATMIEAGHPELTFELATFSRDMPPHWKEKGPMATPRAWVAGQAAALREALLQLSDRGAAENDVDEIKRAWSETRSHAMLLRHALPADAAKGLNDCESSLEGCQGDPKKVAPLAKDTAAKVDSWGPTVEKMEFDSAKTLALLNGVLGDTETMASGFYGINQTSMAVDMIYGAYKEAAGDGLDGGAAEKFEKGLDSLFAALEDENPDSMTKKAQEAVKACAEAAKAFK